eukprot:302630_1
MAQQDIQPTAFDEWLFQNGIRISRSLREKLFHHHLDSVDVLTELKAANDIESALQLLNLDVIQKAIFSAIIRKVPVLVSHNSLSNEGAQHNGTQPKSITPQLLSLKDNNDGTVDIKVKLVEAEVDPALKGSLRLEWADDEKALDMGSKTGINLGSNDMELNTEHELKNIAVKSNADVFRLSMIWKRIGNIKPLALRVEKWDLNHKGDVISVNDNTIKHVGTGNAWRSIYGTVECKAPYIYHWKFRIKTYGVHFMFGVEKVGNNYGLEQTYAGAKGAVYYSYDDTTYIYHTQDGNHITGDYGSKRLNKNGGELDMYLDLSCFEVRFETNGQDVGYKIQNLSEENYRMVTSPYTPGTRLELVQFDCSQ